MSKNICVIGIGYVGLLTAVGLADFGNYVVGIDIDSSKIKSLQSGKSPIFEPGIEEYLRKNLASNRLSFSVDVSKSIKDSQVIFIAVGTPSKENGEADLRYIIEVLDNIRILANEKKTIVIKSTVPIGTNRRLHEYLSKDCIYNHHIVSNPEFLREGKAVYDFFHPDRVVIGSNDEDSKEIMKDVYRSLNRINVPFVWCDWESSELIKYASNCFLALKIGYINQIASFSEIVGADVQVIAKAMGMDGRIGPKFLHAGPGYGGSCFPKDTRALSAMGKKVNAPISIIDALVKANEEQKVNIYNRLKKRLDNFNGKKVCILGLSFKAETDDIRESCAITIVNNLLKDNIDIQVHDPKAMLNFSKEFPNIIYADNEYEAIKNCDALLILTEWNEYRSLDLVRIKQIMRTAYIFDTRNVVDIGEMDRLGFSYDLIGKRTHL